MRLYTEEDKETQIIKHLLLYAKHNKDFKRNYIDGVHAFLERDGYITLDQLRELRNIADDIGLKEFIQHLGKEDE